MALLHQDLGHYSKISSREETIRRSYISFRLCNIVFTDQSTEGNLVASGIKPSSNREYHYRSDCASFSTPVWYNEDPKNFIDNVEGIEELARKVAGEYIRTKYEGAEIIDLKVMEARVTFFAGASLRKDFALDLTTDVVLEERVIS